MAQTSLQQALNLFNGSPDPTPDYSNYNQSNFDNSFQFTPSGATDDSTPLNNPALSYGPHDLSTYAPGLVTPVASALTANPHGGEQKIGNYSTGTYTPTAAQIRNQANTDKYPLNDYSADDRFRTDGGMQPNRGLTPTTTSPNPGGGGGGGGYSGPAPIPSINISQDLAQRQQTGNIYAPDLSAYNDSSLFNYTGPGGLDEYTYGQNLPYQGAGYDIWGSPTDVANPYYEGQYAPLPTPVVTQPEPVGPADGAIGMSPVVMPPGIPPVSVQPPSSTNQPSMPGFTGSGTGGGASGGGTGPDGKDLTYQETIDYFGLTPQSTTFPSPGGTVADKDYQDMLDKALAGTMDNQLQNQLDSSKPASVMMDEQQNYEVPEGLINNGGGGRAIIPWVNTKTGETFAAPHTGFEAIAGSDWTPAAGNKFTKEFTPLQQLARAEAGNIDTRDFRFNPTGEQDKSLLQKWVEDGPGYQPTSDATLAEMEAMANQVKTFADKTSLIRNMGVEQDNLFDEHYDRNQAEYKPTLSDYHPDATPMQLAGSGSTLSGEKLNTRHPAYQAQLDRVANESENIFQNQDVDADAYQRALEKDRYQTQINNPTADFSGHMKNYGSGFKSHEPQAKLSDVSSATPMQLAGSGSTLSGDQLNTRHPAYQAGLDRAANESENIFQTQDVEADAYQRALEKDRYQTQINNPTADFSGTMKNYGSGFKEPQASLSDVTDAKPLGFAENAGQMESRNTNIFDAKREDSPFARGPSDNLFQGHMDEQQNYEVPAEEMSPGKVGLFNGIIEGLQNFGPNSERTTGEQKAWDKYYEYKNPAIEALNKGQIDEQAFNEIKGKVGSSTIVNHFIDRGDHPYINSLASNVANTFYQGVDVIAGDDSIMDGLTDLHQQGAGSNDQSKLGSVAEVIAEAKEATQQRKEVQENIFTPGPMKFAAVASKPKPVVVKKSKPVRTPVVTKKATTKKTVKTGPSGTTAKKSSSTPKKGTGSSGPPGRNYSAPAKKSAPVVKKTTSPSISSRYGRRGGW